MIEYELRKAALEHAMALAAGRQTFGQAGVQDIIHSAKKFEDYLLFGLRHKEPEKRDPAANHADPCQRQRAGSATGAPEKRDPTNAEIALMTADQYRAFRNGASNMLGQGQQAPSYLQSPITT